MFLGKPSREKDKADQELEGESESDLDPVFQEALEQAVKSGWKLTKRSRGQIEEVQP